MLWWMILAVQSVWLMAFAVGQRFTVVLDKLCFWDTHKTVYVFAALQECWCFTTWPVLRLDASVLHLV